MKRGAQKQIQPAITLAMDYVDLGKKRIKAISFLQETNSFLLCIVLCLSL